MVGDQDGPSSGFVHQISCLHSHMEQRSFVVLEEAHLRPFSNHPSEMWFAGL